jgi:hypothetical protein
MVRKNMQHQPKLSPNESSTGAKAKKQSKEKNKDEKKAIKEQKKVAFREAKEREKFLRTSVDKIRAQVINERAQAARGPAEIQKEFNRALQDWKTVQSELEKAKELARKRKDEIDEWKTWYEKLPAAEKASSIDRLQNEIRWRADELATNGNKINELIPKEFETRGKFEMAKQKLDAFHAGVHKRPIEEDPRLTSIISVLGKQTAAITQLKSEQQGLE